MKTQNITVILLTLMTLTSIGLAFATMENSYACHWNQCWNQCWNTCDNCKLRFIDVEYWDNEVEKDVGDIYAWIECGHVIEIRICNAYPCYTAYINFTIKNKGSLDVHIDEVFVENPNPEALETTLNPNLECIWIKPCHKIEGQLAVHIIQTAQECHTYTFEITIQPSCGDPPHPRTRGFWKHQFKVALRRKGEAQVDPDTLEELLDEISAESEAFEFTGSRKDKFQQALEILRIWFSSSMEEKLKAHLLALWLNYIADWTEGYTLDGMTAYEIIEGSENALINNLDSEYEYWKDLCDDFNNLG